MRVLITGCQGQVGSYLTRLIYDVENTSVLPLDKNSLDITNRNAVMEVVEKFQPEIIINAAAYTSVDKAEEEVDACYAINCDGPRFLAEAAQSVDATILHISTDYVFSGDKEGEYTEEDIPAPKGVYGESKLAGELAIKKACKKHIILRTAWVFSECGDNFVTTMLRLGMTRNDLNIVNDQYGGPTYAGDIAQVLIKIANDIVNNGSKEFGVYHFSGLPHVSWFEFSSYIFDLAFNQGIISKKINLTPVPTKCYPSKANRPINSRLKTDKVSRVFLVEVSDWRKALQNIKAYKGLKE